MIDSSQTSSSPEPVDPNQEQNTQQTWIAFHNTLIIGFFSSQDDATQALHGYQMDNQIDINDTTGVNQLL